MKVKASQRSSDLSAWLEEVEGRPYCVDRGEVEEVTLEDLRLKVRFRRVRGTEDEVR